MVLSRLAFGFRPRLDALFQGPRGRGEDPASPTSPLRDDVFGGRTGSDSPWLLTADLVPLAAVSRQSLAVSLKLPDFQICSRPENPALATQMLVLLQDNKIRYQFPLVFGGLKNFEILKIYVALKPSKIRVLTAEGGENFWGLTCLN